MSSEDERWEKRMVIKQENHGSHCKQTIAKTYNETHNYEPGSPRRMKEDENEKDDLSEKSEIKSKLMQLQPDDLWFENKMMGNNFKRIKGEINKASDAKKQGLANYPIVVVFIDSGCYSSHPRLNGMIIHDKEVVPGDDPTDDDVNHGTKVAGVLWRYAGQIVDGFKGNESVVKLINIKLKHGRGDEYRKAFQLIDKWEKDKGRNVDIITLSCGFFEKSDRAAMRDVNVTLANLSKDRIIMAAASNEGKTNPQTVAWPATQQTVLGINAITDYGNPTEFSPQGDGIDFAFPGKQIATTSRPPKGEKEKDEIILVRQPNEYWALKQDGTSFAAPHCAAAVAIVLAYTHIGLGKKARAAITNTEDIRNLMIPIAATEKDHQMGYGFPYFEKLFLDTIKSFLIDEYKLLQPEDLDAT